jgi:hypothetical protein
MQEFVNLDDIIEYITNTHVISDDNNEEEEDRTQNADTILAHMAGRSSNGTSPGDIRKVLASTQGPTTKKKVIKMNETSTTPETLVIDDTTYYLHKGETITYQGRKYTAHFNDGSLLCRSA